MKPLRVVLGVAVTLLTPTAIAWALIMWARDSWTDNPLSRLWRTP